MKNINKEILKVVEKGRKESEQLLAQFKKAAAKIEENLEKEKKDESK